MQPLPDFVPLAPTPRVITAVAEGFERITSGEGEATVFVFALPGGQAVATHSHPRLRVTFVRSGAASLLLGSERCRLLQGSVVVIPSGVEHSLQVDEGESLFLVEVEA